jgi:hypothetical protein
LVVDQAQVDHKLLLQQVQEDLEVVFGLNQLQLYQQEQLIKVIPAEHIKHHHNM